MPIVSAHPVRNPSSAPASVKRRTGLGFESSIRFIAGSGTGEIVRISP